MSRKERSQLSKAHYIEDLPAVPNSIISFDKQLVDTRGDRWILLKTADGGDKISISWSRFQSVLNANRVVVSIPDRTFYIAQLYAADRLTRKAPSTVNNDVAALHRLLQSLLTSKAFVIEE